ncbi:hypothetical protein CJ030_MR4G003867 [Morella rubra]|uniref:RING-type domain-containing protein n=1 Tax=Morella rubra TaxID=262757 RepID=A0A6A1VVE2_9ROSI|nr:hypothetical protein CJ030_MR4G003867 [Morella rubra]
MYSASENLCDAHKVFDEITSINTVCWTALISAYVDNQRPAKALQMFRQMQMADVKPDSVTVTVALSACADVGALEMGEWIHAYSRSKDGLDIDLSLNNALINMYAKCGDIGTARRLFDRMNKKDVTTWTSMVVGHALHGQAEEALKLYSKMKGTNNNSSKSKRNSDSGSFLIVPNVVTFIGVLMACSHAGMVEEGKQHFKSMSEDYGLKPRESHFGCMVDLFCRAGHLKEAYDFISEMPEKPTAVVWRTFLAACSLKGDIEIAAEAQRRLLELDPGHAGDSVAMSNIYAAKGMWDKKIVVRGRIKQRRAPGCSSIEVGTRISEFVAADKDHPLRAFKHKRVLIKRSRPTEHEHSTYYQQHIAKEICQSRFGSDAGGSCVSSSVRLYVPVMDNAGIDGARAFRSVPRLIVHAVSGALTGFFAVAGAFTGAIAGALAGKASDSGVLRGAGLGAVAGAVLSLEVLEASRAYWSLERYGSRSTSSMADFVEELFRGRFVEEQFAPAMLTAYRWQVLHFLQIFGSYNGRSIMSGCDGAQAIVFRDIEVGEIARSLPRCHHVFHLKCVDKWLLEHVSCPLLRKGFCKLYDEISLNLTSKLSFQGIYLNETASFSASLFSPFKPTSLFLVFPKILRGYGFEVLECFC